MSILLLLKNTTPDSLNITEVGYWAGVKGDAFPSFVADDVAIVASCTSNATPPTLLSGWTDLGTAINTDSGYNIAMRLQYKVLVGGEDTSELGTGVRVAGGIFRGIDGSNILEDDHGNGDDANVDFPGLVTTSASLVLLYGFRRDSNGWDMPSGFTNEAEKASPGPIGFVGSNNVMSFAGGVTVQSSNTFGYVVSTVALG